MQRTGANIAGRRRFGRERRLLKAGQFSQVFAEPIRSTDGLFTVLARSNGLAHARLGLAVSRKAARAAVARNRIKRLVREAFREAQAELPALDIVVIARPAAADATNEEMRRQIARHWNRIRRQCDASSLS